LALDVYYRRKGGENPQREEYLSRFPDLEPTLMEGLFSGSTEKVSPSPPQPLSPEGRGGKSIPCPHCQNPIQLPAEKVGELLCPAMTYAIEPEAFRRFACSWPLSRRRVTLKPAGLC
jgi:hypothetical protein